MKTLSAVLALLFILGVSAGIEASIVFTNENEQFSSQAGQSFNGGSPPQGSVISVDDSTHYQTIQGFGAALTDSSAYLIYNLNGNDYWNVINSLFSPSSGIGIGYIRLTISACDFSLSDYTYDNMPEGQTDPGLQSFSINHDLQYIIPVLQSIKQVNPNVKIMASPWSPPAWMKTSDTMNGSTDQGNNMLQNVFYNSYANYFVKFIQAYEAQGITIDTLTVQNEPLYGPSGYPGMYMPAQEQSDFINNYLAKAFLENNIQTKVFVYDHNWDNEEYPIYVFQNLNSQSSQIVGGAAFHCYAGDVSNQTNFHNSYPNTHLFLTECSGGDWIPGFQNTLLYDMENLFIGAVNNWAEVSIKWNLALDHHKGPQNGGCNDCRGLITINTDTNQVTQEVDYYTVGTFSKYVKQGATRIQVNSDNGNLIATGFNNPDNSRVVIVLNKDGSNQQFSMSWNNSYFQSTIPGNTVAVYTWTP